MTKIFECLEEWQQTRKKLASNKNTLGFVPTMGNLHAGHASLLHRAKTENQFSLLTIFVNPTQFDNKQDLTHYPRTLEADIKLAQDIGVDFLLLPNAEQLYADDYRFRVSENDFSKKLCGEFRQGHFDGVLTVVLKLLMLAKATRAYFGEKDWQQLQLIRDMVAAFFIDTDIIACPTIRDTDGLALSSRNSRLSPMERQLASHFPRLLKSKQPVDIIRQELEKLGFTVDYVLDLQMRRLAAVRIGHVRLIDNISLSE